MHTLMNCYQSLREGRSLSDADARYLLGAEPQPFQVASLCVQLLSRPAVSHAESALVRALLQRHPSAATYLPILFPSVALPAAPSADPTLAAALAATATDRTLGADRIALIVDRFTRDELPLEFMATWLMTVCARGLSDDDTRILTLKMRDSGRTHDYRGLVALDGAKVIRRYPTGALSEKAALILPSLLASVRDRFPIASPFLVARSLGFTGGTWDKLKAIDGFTFPAPGDDSVRAMRACGVAMAVTHGDVNPADRKMYAFRSTCGTIETNPLLVSSIASKQLALPADHLLMDVRYGDGAFCATRAAGERLGRDLVRLCTDGGTPSSYLLTDTIQPNGSAVGNALEVLEAIAVMAPQHSAGWEPRALDEQRMLVLRFFASLMAEVFPAHDERHYRALGAEQLASGAAFESFLHILEAHGVDASVRDGLRRNPRALVGPRVAPRVVRARHAGTLSAITQRALGFVVNFRLGGGGNEYAGEFDPRPGVLLHKRVGDRVEAGEVLCEVFASEGRALEEGVLDELAGCFTVGAEASAVATAAP